MQRTIFPRAAAAALALLLPLSGLQTGVEAQQQPGERMSILVVPAFANKVGDDNGFGEDVAEEVVKLLEELPKHQPADEDKLDEAKDKYGVEDDELVDCIKARQLAGMPDVGIPLVLCGEFEQTASGHTVTARIISPESGETFDVEPIETDDKAQAAAHIVSQFELFAQGLELAYYCNDYLESSNWQQALDNCERALEINDQAKGALYGKGQALWKLERREEAMAAFEQLLAIEQGLHQEALLSAALVAAELGDNEKSTQYLHDYLELDPGNTQVRLQIATDAANAGNPEGGLEIIEAGLTGENANDVTLREYAGHMAINAANNLLDNAAANGGNETEANALLTKALDYYEPVFAERPDSVSPTMIRNMLQAYRRLEQNDLAVQFGEKAIAAHPDDAGLHSAYADALNDIGRTADALAMLERVTQIDPSYNVNARKGLWLLETGDLAGAQAAFQAAIESGDLDANQLDALAQQIAKTGYDDKSSVGQFQAAKQYYDVARELAQTPKARGMIAFFEGYDIFKQAEARAQNQDLETAQATLPMFNQVLALMEEAAPFGATSPTNEKNRQTVMQAASEHRQIAQMLIDRGR